MHKTEQKKTQVCTWVGEGEGCRLPTIYGKSYCESHHDRVYTKLFSEMATYMIEKELESNNRNY